MSEDSSTEEESYKKPKRYALQWAEGIRPDEEDMEIEVVGED